MTINRASWTQRLDAAGEFSAELPLSDPQTAAILAGRIYRHYQEGRGFCFAGSMESLSKIPDELLSISGDSLLVELLHENTLVNRSYTNVAINTIIDDLLDGTGWTRLGSITDVISVRFDGESILRAVIAVVEMVGKHIREVVTEASGTLVRQLEIGSFGDPSGVVVSNGQADELAIGDHGMAVIPEGAFSVEETTSELWNWVIPLGAGEGTAQLTLVQQTRVPSLITVNPSFESGLTGWTLTGVPTADRTRSVHGSACVKMVTSGTDIDVRQTVPASAGAKYRAEAWTWKETFGGNDRLIVEFLDGAAAVLSTVETLNTTLSRWIRLDTGEMTAPANTVSLRIRLVNRVGGHTSYFDLPRVWRVASDIGQPYDVLTEVTSPTVLFAQINWYITDAVSVTTHGRRQRPFVAKDIVPLSATKPAYQAAANSLYDLASAQLDRWKLQQNAYRLDTLGLKPDVLPGDTIRLRYKGMARRSAGDAIEERYMYVDLDEDLYVLERTTSWDEYSSDTLLVSDLDRQLQNDDEVVIGKLEDTVRAFRTHVQTSLSVWAEHLGPELVDATRTFSFNARIPDNVVQLLRLLCTITPRLIRSPVNVASNSGGSTPTTSSGGGFAPTTDAGGSVNQSSASGGSVNQSSAVGGVTASSVGSQHSHTISGQTAISGGGSSGVAGGSHAHQLALFSDTGVAIDNPAGASIVRWGALRFRQSAGGAAADVQVGHRNDADEPVDDIWSWDTAANHQHSIPDHTHSVSATTSAIEASHFHDIAQHQHSIVIAAHTHGITIAAHQHSVTIPTHQHTVTVPAHGHNIAFGIFEGSQAAGIGIRIDGTLRTTELAGPWSAPITLDLTRFFLDNDGMVVQGDHTIELSSVQLGRIEARLEWAVTAAAIGQ